MYKSPQKACLSSSPYLAPVWKVKNLVSQANCHRCGSDSCVGRTSAWGILNVVRPMAGWFIGANEMIYSQWQKHAFCHHLGWSRWTKITVIIPQSERQKGKKKKKTKHSSSKLRESKSKSNEKWKRWNKWCKRCWVNYWPVLYCNHVRHLCSFPLVVSVLTICPVIRNLTLDYLDLESIWRMHLQWKRS